VVGWDFGDGRVLSMSSVAGFPSVKDENCGRPRPNAMTWAGAGTTCIADCNGSGSLNILDFICFQQKFQQGCG
jgi:hypothetical protein